jgi:hypothetical protein
VRGRWDARGRVWGAIGVIAGVSVGVAGSAVLEAQQARWHRYTQSQLDPATHVDVVKDVFSQRCYAVYVTVGVGYPRAVAATSLGEVPCDPLTK